MKKRLSGFPIKRDKLFILANGTYVIQWSEVIVRTLFDDTAYAYRADQDYGVPVSDFELKQLQLAKRISHFNHQYIWLNNRPGENTSLPAHKRATRVSKQVQLNQSSEGLIPQTQSPDDPFSDSIDTGQMIRTLMPSRHVLIMLQNPTEQDLLRQLLAEMQFDVTIRTTAEEGLRYIEEHSTNLVISDLILPDMHAWQMIAKLHEITPNANTPVLIITDEVMPTMRAFAGEHIARPVSVSRLRYHLWKALQERSQFDKVFAIASSFSED